jgi:hypothetical protein
MELIEVIVRAVGISADGLTGGVREKTGKTFYIFAIVLVIAIFLFILIMSQ